MLVQRKQMIDHLGKIYAEGQIKEAVLFDGFACNALNPDGQLFVSVPSLKGVEPLPEPVGVVGIDLVRSIIGDFPSDVDQVEIDVEDDRIKIDQRYGDATKGEVNSQEYRLVTAAPNLIGSNVKAATVKKFLEKFPAKGAAGSVFPLPQLEVEGIVRACSRLAPEVITLKVGKTGGIFMVGQESGHYSKLNTSVKLRKGEEPYDLLFSAKLFLAVIKQLSDYTATKLILSTPEKEEKPSDCVVMFRDGDYRYILSPLEAS